MVQEMLSGYTGGDDQKAILTILQDATPDDRERIVGKVGIEKLTKKFDGDERDQLYLLLGSVAKHKKDPVDTNWSVSYSIDGGGASRPQRMALVVDQLQAQPSDSNTPLNVVNQGKPFINNNPTGAPMTVPGNVSHPRNTAGIGFMGFHIAAQRPDLSAAEIPGMPIQAPYPALSLDKHQVQAKVGIHLGSEKVGEHQVQKGSESEQADSVEKGTKKTTGSQVSTGQKVTAGNRVSASDEKVVGKEHQESKGTEKTDSSSRTISLSISGKLTPELSAKLAAKTGIQVDGGLLAAILAVAEPEGALLAAELGKALESIKFNLEGSAEFGFKVTLEIAGSMAVSWTSTHSETVRKGSVDSQKEELRLKGEVDVTGGQEASSGRVDSASQETSETRKSSTAERSKSGVTDTNIVNKLTVDKADVAFDVR
jgi:hypothetical protein